MRRSLRWAAPIVVGALLAMTACGVPGPEGSAVSDGEIRIEEFEVPGPAAPSAVPQRPGSERVPVRVYEPRSAAGDGPVAASGSPASPDRGAQTGAGAAGGPWATLVWAHGGSFVRGTLDWPEADWVARSFAAAGVRVVSVDYVLADETVKAPAPANDVAAALAWAAAEYDGPVIAGGASAGAHLAVLAALDRAEAADGRAAAALLLEYPTLHRVQRAHPALAAATEGVREQRRFRAERISEMYAVYLGDGGDGLVAGELPPERLAQLPPTIIVNADADELRASGEEFAEQLRAAGVPVSEATQPGTEHGYLNRPEESEAALAAAEETIAHFVEELRLLLAS